MRNKKRITAVLALACLSICIAVPGTLAVLSARTQKITNTFLPDPAAVVAPAGKEEIKTLPQTGDASSLALWAALLLCGAGGAVSLRRKRS